MTPKEKSDDLVSQFKKYAYYPKTKDDELFVNELKRNAKECAIISVNLLLDELSVWGAPYLFEDSVSNDWAEKRITNYWQQVKQEIEKL